MIAALEQYLRDTTRVPEEPVAPAVSPWKRAALAEGVSRRPELGEF